MIPDRMIEQGTLRTDGSRVSLEVRLPWYRALPASCISDVRVDIDGTTVPAESLTWQLNGREFRISELATTTDEWWFPTDSAVVSGELPLAPGEHRVDLALWLYIPYIVTDHGVLRIEEHASTTMEASAR